MTGERAVALLRQALAGGAPLTVGRLTVAARRAEPRGLWFRWTLDDGRESGSGRAPTLAAAAQALAGHLAP